MNETKASSSSIVDNNDNDNDFFDAESTHSQEIDNHNPPPRRTPTPSPPPRRTVLTYSDRNGLQPPTFDLTHHRQLKFDANDDFALSNRLNAIVLSNALELHHFVFHNDLDSILAYIKRHEATNASQLADYLSIRDHHGNTPLHLAAMLGHIELARLLTDRGAVVKARNRQLWTPLNEAIAYGNRELIRTVLVKFENEVEKIVDESKPKIVKALEDMLDFYVEIKWDFESWIPLVSRFLPSDTCKLYKSGRQIRLDCTLGDLAAKSASGGGRSSDASSASNNSNTSSSSSSPFNWQRGDLTFLFDIDKIGDKNSIVFIDNKKKTFCFVDKKEESGDDNVDSAAAGMDEKDLEKEIDLLLGREMIHIKLDTRQANFLPTQTGWFSKRDKVEEINGYQCQFYDVSNLYIVSKLRNEHLSEEEIRKREDKHKKMKEKMKSQHNSHMKKSKSKQKIAETSNSSNNKTNDISSTSTTNINNNDLDSLINTNNNTSSINSNSNSNNNNNNNSMTSVRSGGSGNNETAQQDLDDVDVDLEDMDDYDDFMIEHRPSLPPPPKTNVTWSEYICAEEGCWPHLGRKVRCKETRKEFKAQLAMSQDFPLTIQDLNNLLEALAPLAKFRKLKEFINLKLPPGFPVKIDIPIVHTITAKVSFQNFKKNYKSDPILFRIPPNYTEENIQDALFKDSASKKEASPSRSST